MKLFGAPLLVLFFFLLVPSFTFAEKILVIKYRSTPVDVDKTYFEYLDTSKSSVVRAAWYDAKQQYMIINLNGTNYHYCGLDKRTWEMFKKAESFGTTYGQRIKGNFDCRVYPVGEY